MNLTIKHIGSDGTEQIMSCGSFFAERTRADTTVTYCAFRGTHRGTELLNVWSGEVNPNPEGNDAVIYVVNDKGSTVAIHRYDDSAFHSSLTLPAPESDPLGQLSFPFDTLNQER